MTTVERSTTVPATPDQVWAVLADFGALASWAPNVDHSSMLTAETDGIGAARRVQVGRTTLVETITVCEPSSTLAYTIAGLPPVVRSVSNTWRLRATGDSTVVTLTTDIDAGPRPPQKLIAKAVGRKLGQASDEMLTGLATRLRTTTTKTTEQD